MLLAGAEVGLELGLGCTCIHSLLCPITVSQKPLDTGYKGLDDVDVPGQLI